MAQTTTATTSCHQTMVIYVCDSQTSSQRQQLHIKRKQEKKKNSMTIIKKTRTLETSEKCAE